MRVRRDPETGATMLEFAITAPILVLLIVGLVEFGFAFLDFQVVTGATREGARVGAAFGPDPLADSFIQDAVSDALSDLRASSEVKELWVFASDESGAVVDEVNTTNKYLPDGAGGWACDPGNGCPWDPAARRTDLSNSPVIINRDYLGIRVIFAHAWVVGLLPFPAPTWTDDTVMLLEPVFEADS